MTDLTKERLSELRTIAEKATLGEWQGSALAPAYIVGPYNLDFPVVAAVVEYNPDGTVHKEFDNAINNAAHIAAFDPSTCLKLVKQAELGNKKRGLVIMSALINFVDWLHSEGLLPIDDEHERAQLILKFLAAHSAGENYFMKAEQIAEILSIPFED